MVLRKLFRIGPRDEKLEQGLEKTRRGVFRQVIEIFQRGEIDDDFYDDLEAVLIGADIGVETTERLMDELRAQIRARGLRTPAEAQEILRAEMITLLKEATRHRKVKIFQRGVPFVIMVVGVNGVGKTTTIAKLARFHREKFRRAVIIAAGDTFRAAAIDQLQVWGQRLDVPVIAHQPGADPGAVVFDAMQAAHTREADILIVDTAGRLHTKYNLMQELTKIRRVMQKTVPHAPQEVLLVIDANTGQNGLRQAEEFAKSVEITDIALTKLDGTSKGGIAFAVTKALGVPISYVGTGEQLDDLTEFNAESFVDALFFEEITED
ncbi:MAG TPA: signal recognition particle-docking protein FtsY [Thermomicrobiales bacterium]|nr:signal recognition particle-docking protein FtsY [Thermomicrobiales bacterium]